MKAGAHKRPLPREINVNVTVVVVMPERRRDRFTLLKKVGVGLLVQLLLQLMPSPTHIPDRPGAPQEAARPTAQFATANIVNFATATTANAATPTTNNATTTTTNSAVLPCSQFDFAHSPYMCLNAPGKDLTPRP